MDNLLLLARILLAAIFLVASLAKLKNLAGFRQTLTDFGIRPTFASPISVLLPIAGLAVGLALIPVATVWWGAMGALALLLVFMAGIGTNLAQGKKPDCNCFGQLHSSPIGASTLLRNGLLAGLAGFVVLAGWNSPGASVSEWTEGLISFQVIGLGLAATIVGLLAACVWLLLNLLRQQGRLLLQIEAVDTD